LDEGENSAHLNSTATAASDFLQDSSNSASTLLEDADEAARDSVVDVPPAGVEYSSSTDYSDDDDDDVAVMPLHEEALFGDVSDDGADDPSLAAESNPIEPLLAAAGDSDLSDAN